MNSEANNSDKEGTWEDKIDLEEIPRKIGQLRMSAEAEEFRPRNMYYGPQDCTMNCDANNMPYGHFMGYNQRYDDRKYEPCNRDYSRQGMNIRGIEKGMTTPESKGSATSGQRTSAKVIRVDDAPKVSGLDGSVVGRNGNRVNKVDKRVPSMDMENLSLAASKQEKNHVSVTGDEERKDLDIASQFQEEIDEEVLQDIYGKEHVNVVFIGHVDAGKSTLGGNILYMTGMVDKRTMEKYEKDAKEAGRESWYLSWALDSTKEERSKGKTVELGRAYFETEKRRYTILDAPGHKSYVPNMIEGTAQAEVAVLVISARKGEYETGFEKGGQTREHAMLSKTQGVSKLIVAINKMDDPTVEWSKERYDECTNGITTFLRKEVGYNPKTDFVFMPISAFTGINIKERIDKKICPWYNGPSLLEYLDEMDTFERKLNTPLIIPIQAKYKDMGLVIEGKIESGYVKKGSNVILMPNKTVVEVVGLYNELEEIRVGRCGEQIKLRIKGVEEEDVMTGHILSSLESPVSTAKIFEAQIAILEVKSLLTAGYSCIIHIHSAVQEVTFLKLLYKLDKLTNRRSKKPPAFATKGMKIVALLEVASPLCLETFDKYKQLGRFILRNEGLTVAIGKVTKLISEE
ncbi:hypothetical protein T552_03371 [Pneumocystis carinii B80]|uniref:Eukaryotic peptide chain release factor GTP-binding subunit n=2 Tax=Pneumocystis carinii TaxID=4754 RepID=A0A0W4ZBU3_PNEC8|nr:hypothetical protein T552_03371 [Pneumocystis carinii B80]KTW25758.1 hypothetical protein T552_03371 [Pneumocystis carinii B80]BAB61042.1 eukaryotic release factor 3 [Pneumocystis carinii]